MSNALAAFFAKPRNERLCPINNEVMWRPYSHLVRPWVNVAKAIRAAGNKLA